MLFQGFSHEFESELMRPSLTNTDSPHAPWPLSLTETGQLTVGRRRAVRGRGALRSMKIAVFVDDLGHFSIMYKTSDNATLSIII